MAGPSNFVPVTAAEEMAIDVLKPPLAPPGVEC